MSGESRYGNYIFIKAAWVDVSARNIGSRKYNGQYNSWPPLTNYNNVPAPIISDTVKNAEHILWDQFKKDVQFTTGKLYKDIKWCRYPDFDNRENLGMWRDGLIYKILIGEGK